MDGQKPFWKSLGVMGPALGLFAMILNHVAGAPIVNDDDVNLVVAESQAMVDAGATLWSTLTAIIGRWRARKTISIK